MNGLQRALATFIDRHSKFSLIAKVPNKGANNVTGAIVDMLTPFKEHLHTVTFDNRKEFTYHSVMAQELAVNVYFAHPYHSWERFFQNKGTIHSALLGKIRPKKGIWDARTARIW